MKRLMKIMARVAHPILHKWAERRLWELRAVVVLPMCWWRGVYRVGMWLVGKRRWGRVAGWLVHRVPFQVRVRLA